MLFHTSAYFWLFAVTFAVYWGVLRTLHYMPARSVARAILRTVTIPAEESYPTLLELQPGRDKGSLG